MGVLTDINTSMLGRNSWPPPGMQARWADIELLAAFRMSDSVKLRQYQAVRFRHHYMVSPVPRMVSRASANLLYGAPPEFTDETNSDQANLDRIVDENFLATELHRAALISSSEGEVWGRILVRPDLLDVPVIEFVSPGRVIPHFEGRFLIAVTFVTEWCTSSTERVRLLERYEAGAVVAELYRGTRTQLGMKISLDAFDATAGMTETVLTGFDYPLAAFIPNSIDSDPTRGYADYHGLEDRFLAVNESATIGQANMRLVGKKRALIDGKYLDSRQQVPDGDDVWIKSGRETGDLAQVGPLQVIDYDLKAADTIAWLDHLIDTSLAFAGIAPQLVGRGDLGRTPSGTALKLRAAHSLLEASGKGRYFDRGVGRLLQAAKVIDSRPTSEGGFGRPYTQADSLPAIERDSGLPQDDLEAATQLTAWVNAEAISLEERVAFLHPDWSDEQQADEVQRIRNEQSTAAPGIATPRPAITIGQSGDVAPNLPGPDETGPTS